MNVGRMGLAPAWLGAALGLIAFALGLAQWHFSPVAILSICIATIGIFLFPYLDRRWAGQTRSISAGRDLLCRLLICQVAFAACIPFLIYVRVDWWSGLVTAARCGFFVSVLLLAASLVLKERPLLRLNGIRGSLAVLLVLYVATPLASPDPQIDVHKYFSMAADVLLDGRNPYTAEYQNPYGNFMGFYPEGVPKFFYPPLTLVYALAGHAVGDVRWLFLLSHLGAAVLMFCAARNFKLPLDESLLYPGLLLSIPGGFFLIEQSWTDPSLVLAMAAALYFSSRKSPEACASAFGCLLALKQTMIFVVPFLILWRRLFFPTWRCVLWVLLIPFLSYVGFFLWSPTGLYNALVRFHMLTPVRADGLTLTALIHYWGLGLLPSLSGIGYVAAVAWFAKIRGHDDETAFWVGLAGTYLLTLLLSKHAFYNYYYGAYAMTLLAILRSRRIAEETPLDPVLAP